MLQNNLEEPWVETIVLPRKVLILYDLFHNQVSEVDSSVVGDSKSNDLNHSGDAVEFADFWSEDMADCSEEKIPFLLKMILVQHLGNHVVLVKCALYPSEESEKFLV